MLDRRTLAFLAGEKPNDEMKAIRAFPILLMMWANHAAGAADMSYIYPPAESARDKRHLFHWKVLETALEKTRAKYGAYTMINSSAMGEARQAFELARPAGSLTVAYLADTPERERTLYPVKIPVDRGLASYHLLLIRRDRQAEFDRVTSVADLRRHTFGQDLGGIEADIFRANGLTVATGSSYTGLFEMLQNGRFDALPRGVIDVPADLSEHRSLLPGVAVEKHLLLYYPMPMYFWFSRGERGERLAARAEAGMRMMLADGSYARLFAEFQDAEIAALDLARRRILRLSNPLSKEGVSPGDPHLWFDPRTYRSHAAGRRAAP